MYSASSSFFIKSRVAAGEQENLAHSSQRRKNGTITMEQNDLPKRLLLHFVTLSRLSYFPSVEMPVSKIPENVFNLFSIKGSICGLTVKW